MSSDLDDALDRLYAATPAEFVKLRKELVAELKAAGETTASFRLSDRQKPSKAEWAINQVARAEPKLLQDFVRERERAAAAQQKARDPEKLRDALETYRSRLGAVAHAVMQALDESGTKASPAERRRVVQTLETAASDPASREDLVRGRIGPGSRDADPIAALAADAERARAAPDEDDDEDAETKRERIAAERRAKAERAERVAKAKKEFATREREHKKARDADERARQRLDQAQKDAKQAREELQEASEKLEEARTELRDLGESDD
jgi:hypothetical protein